MGYKQVIANMTITAAGSSHNCRANDAHRIPKGTKRLTIKEDGKPLHYCLGCARLILAKGQRELQAITNAVDAECAEPANDVAATVIAVAKRS